MTKQEAEQRWNRIVKNTAQSYAQEFPGEPLDTEWSEAGFQDVPRAVVETLELSNPWREFHDAVSEKL